MGMLSKVLDVASGGLAKQVIEAVQNYWPPELSPDKKAELQLQLQTLADARERATADAVNEAEKRINERVAQYEGTAADLRGMPLIGPLMLFVRGAFRPVCAYAVLVLDFKVFSGSWSLAQDSQLASAFWVINVLVLGFFFGERAVRNVMPLITETMARKNGPA